MEIIIWVSLVNVLEMSWDGNKLVVLEDSLIILSLSRSNPQRVREQTRKHAG